MSDPASRLRQTAARTPQARPPSLAGGAWKPRRPARGTGLAAMEAHNPVDT